MENKTYTNQDVSKTFDEYALKYYRGNSAALGRAEGVDASYVRRMRVGKNPVRRDLLSLIGFARVGINQHTKNENHPANDD